MEYEYCPKCKISLRGDEIPKENRHYYNGRTHYSKVIGIYSLEKDRTIKWKCPDCNHIWEEVD